MIKEITQKEAINIIDNRRPLGLFLLVDNGVFVGIDNSDGSAYVEEFPEEVCCKNWLEGFYTNI